MIRAIILDVDGVIVGQKAGYNFPYPHPDVIKRLKQIRASGIPIALCSAKAHFSITKIIKDAGLDNLHITDGGAVILDPLCDKIEGKHLLPTPIAKELVRFFQKAGSYIEAYTTEDWYILENAQTRFSRIHTAILQKKPVRVKNLLDILDSKEITKFILMVNDDADKQKHIKMFAPFQDKLQISWTSHPTLSPGHIVIVTAPGVSKGNGAEEIAKSNGISLAETLGVGDTGSDWQFMQLCGYVAAMGNGTDELKKLVTERGENGFIGESVEENGILSILDHFQCF